MTIYQGACYCNKVQFKVEGLPLFAQYCHCTRCRKLAEKSQEPNDKVGYSYTIAYLTKCLTMITSNEQLKEDITTKPNAILYSCKDCHSQIYGIAKDAKMRYAIGINGNTFKFVKEKPKEFLPLRHVYYANRVKDMKDNLPKFIDMPTELGGSGKMVKATMP